MQKQVACDIISRLSSDIVFYMFEMAISKHRSISQILKDASSYSQCFDGNQETRRTENFYNDRGWKIILKVIGRMVLLHAPRELFYGELEEGFIPISPLPEDSKNFYPSKLFEFVSIPSTELSIFDSWNKYRLAWDLHDEKLYLLDNDSNRYPLGKNTLFAHSTLYFAFIEKNELKIFLDKPWIDVYAIFRMEIDEIVSRRNFQIQLKETIDGLMLIFQETEQVNNTTYGYETICKIDLVGKSFKVIYEDHRYMKFYESETFEESSTYNYGSSMVLIVEEESSTYEKTIFGKLQSYDENKTYHLNAANKVWNLGTTGLVGYDWASTLNSHFLIDENGNFIRDLQISSIYFDSFCVVMNTEENGTHVSVKDLLTGEVLANNIFTVSKSEEVFVTRKDDKKGYFIWVN